MKKNKKLFIILFLFFLKVNILSLVFDNAWGTEFDGFKNAGKIKETAFIINNKKIKIKYLFLDAHQGDIIGYYLWLASKNKFRVIYNHDIQMLANIFINNDKDYIYDNFDYIFYIDKNNEGNLIVAGTAFDKTKVVVIKIPMNLKLETNLKKTGALKLPEKITGLIFMKFSGQKENVYYYGCFDSADYDFYIKKWLNDLKQDKWRITNLKNDRSSNKFLLIRKNRYEYFVTFSFVQNKFYLSIIG